MNEQQQQIEDELAFPDLKPGDVWGESITRKRAGELESTLQQWEAEKQHGERRGPSDRTQDDWTVSVLTGADVFWLAARTLAGPNGDVIWAHTALLAHNDMRSYLFPALSMLHLEGVNLSSANLTGANLSLAHLEHALLTSAHLEGASLIKAHLEEASLSYAHLECADLYMAFLEEATLNAAHLEGVHLYGAHLQGANLQTAHLEGKRVSDEDAHRIRKAKSSFPDILQPADMRLAFFDAGTEFKEVIFGDNELGYVSLADVRWGDVNLSIVDWTRAVRGFLGIRKHTEAIELGDEYEAHKAKDKLGKPKNEERRLQCYQDAVRANRQLATALRNQGLNEDADRFAYKAQKLQRQVLWRQRRYGAALGSWLLDLVAGYGYKPMRTLSVYLFALISFAIAYFVLGQTVGPHLSPLGAVVFSMTSFHGRGFFPGGIVLDDPITVLAAFEAFVGLIVEVSFIATFTQRFFAR